MKTSNRLICKAREDYSNIECLEERQNWKILSDLDSFGVSIKDENDFDKNTLIEIYKCVIKRIVDKYGI